jgi:hypothetical protein
MATNTDVYTAVGGVAVTPDNTTIIPYFRALWIGGAGDVAVKFANGSIATHVGVPAATILPVQGTQVLATGTTATDIVAWF